MENNNEELIFILNTRELTEGGFEGSFNEFAQEIEDAGGVVSGDYDEDGAPVMTVYGMSVEDINDLLTDYGVDNAEDFTKEVEDADDFDFDITEEGDSDSETEDDNDTDTEDGDEPIIIDDEDEDDIDDVDDDEEIEIIDDEDEDDIEESLMERKNICHTRRNNVSEKKSAPKGTQNLSESVTMQIVNEVKDKAMFDRIMGQVKEETEQRKLVESYNPPIPFSGITVDGKEVVMMSPEKISEMLKESKFNYKKYYKQYKSLNESDGQKQVKFAKVLKKQAKMIKLLESILNFKTGKLFEDDLFGLDDNNGDNQNQEQNDGSDNNQLSDTVANLTAITFKVKNADNFIKTLVDHGIPEEALQKGGDDSLSSSDENTQEDQQNAGGQQPMDNGMGAGGTAPMGGGAPAPAAGGGNPFESLTTRLSKKNKLNEDDNPFADDGGNDNPFGSTDQPASDSGVDPLNTESNDNNDEGEEVRLVDTSYAAKVQQILQDVYGYKKEDFEDKIGGQIQDENQDDGSEDDDAGQVDDGKAGDSESGIEDEIKPEDVFGNLDM